MDPRYAPLAVGIRENKSCHHLQSPLEIRGREQAEADAIDLRQHMRQERSKPVVRQVQHLHDINDKKQLYRIN